MTETAESEMMERPVLGRRGRGGMVAAMPAGGDANPTGGCFPEHAPPVCPRSIGLTNDPGQKSSTPQSNEAIP